MKHFIIALLIVCMMPTVALYAQEVKTPEVDAQGAILMDFDTGRVLWEKNAHEPLAMASTTKIMTATLALENGNLNDKVKVSRRAAVAPNVKMNLSEGEEISLEALLYALMLQSSNDAAVAIAEHIGGTVENFCVMMTEKAKSLGAMDTVFETPNGLDLGDHHSTAYDMATIARYALAKPEFVKIINTPEKNVDSSKTSYYISNKNRLLNEYEGANGVKTGYTGKAGHCFVGSAQRGELRLISVVLASGWGPKGKEQKWTDTKGILNYGFGAFSFADIIDSKKEAGEILVERSKTDKIGLYYAESLSLPLTEAEKASVKVENEFPESMKAPIAANEKIGVAKVYINGKICNEIDIMTSQAADRHDLKTSMEKVLKAFLEMGTEDEIEIVLPEF